MATDTHAPPNTTPTEVRYWRCSVCEHREWATTAEFKEWVQNPPPMIGGLWRFRKSIPATYCVCQKRSGDEFKDRKVHEYAVPTMRMYKATIHLAPGESLPNIGIKTTLQDTLGGKDPVPENPIDQKPDDPMAERTIQQPTVQPAPVASADPVTEAEEGDPDKLFEKK